MIKHVGKHNNKKVIVLFRKVPGEDHMCLVVYSEMLPSRIHDDIASVLESEVGQQSENFADALDRNVGTDGNKLLHTLHRENYIKKVQTNQVIMVPNAKSQVRLDELNEIIDKLAEGGEAADKMAELDSQSGFRDPAKALPTTDSSADVLTDDQIASKMLADAEAMLAEAKRLQDEAYRIDPSLKPKTSSSRSTASKSTASKSAKSTKSTTSSSRSAKIKTTPKVAE